MLSSRLHYNTTIERRIHYDTTEDESEILPLNLKYAHMHVHHNS